ncbi:hypothetical protein KA977_05650 [Candidatus Dependentiae bacterium]|nr:hypothetical protein [Candidatus Dependentiae bacterium]
MLVTTNLGAYQSLRYFNNTNNVVSKTLQRLSSGLRINSASDDSAGLSVSEKFKSDLLGMQQALRNVQEGISILQIADDSYIQVQNTLNKMKCLAIQSANDTLSDDERAALDNELFQYKVELDRVFRRTTSGNYQHIFGEPETGWMTKTSSETPITYNTSKTYNEGYSENYSIGTNLTTANIRAANASNILGKHQAIDIGTSQTVFTESTGQSETFQTGRTDTFNVTSNTQTKSVGITETTYTPGVTDTFTRGLIDTFTAGNTKTWTRGTHETQFIDGSMNINLSVSPDTASVIVKKITGAGSETLTLGTDYSIGGGGNQTINFFGAGISSGDQIYVEYVEADGSKFDLGEYAETDSFIVKVSSLNGGAALTEGVHYQITDTGTGHRIELLDPAPAGPGGGNYMLIGDNNETHHSINIQYTKQDENKFTISGAGAGERILDYGDGVTGEVVKTVSSLETVGAGTIAAGTTLVKGTHYILSDDGSGNYTGIELIGNYKLKGNKNGAAGTQQQSLKIEYVRTGDNIITLNNPLLDYAGSSTGSEKVTFNGATLTRDTHYTVAGNVITLSSASNFKGSNSAVNNHSFNIKYLTDVSENTIALTNEPANESVMQVRVNGALYADTRFTLNQGATIGTVEGDETLTFDDPWKLRGGDSVTITYMTQDPYVWDIIEADPILSGTEKVYINGTLKTAGTDYTLTSAAGANQITFSAGLITGSSTLSIQYLTTLENSFTLNQNPLDYFTGAGVDDNKKCGSEIVKVNGVTKTAVTHYNIDGNTVSFQYNLSAGDVVTVEYAHTDQFNLTDGTPLDYYVADNDICGSEILKLGGVELTAGAANDYTINGTTIDLSNTTIVGNKSVSIEYADNDTFTLRDESSNPVTPFLDSLEIYVEADPVKKNEGTGAGDWWHFIPDPPGTETNQIQFNPNDGTTNGLRGQNSIEARFIKVATPLTINLENNALNYATNTADGTIYDSALVYIDNNHNGSADAGDELLQEKAVQDDGIDCYWFTAANQIKLSENLQSKLVGNVDLIVDYAYDTGAARSDIITLPATPMNYTPATGSEKIYIKDQDTNGDGLVTAADTDEGWRLLTRSEDGGATDDYVLTGNQVQFVNNGRFAGNPDVYVQYITDNQNLFTTSKKFLDYTDGALDGSEIVTVDGIQLSQTGGDYTVSESSAGNGYDQVTLQGLDRLVGMKSNGTLKPTDDTQHTITIAYDTKNTFSLVDLPFSASNYIGWIIDYENTTGSGMTVTLDGTTLTYGTDYIVNLTDAGNTTDYLNPTPPINRTQHYHSSKPVYNYELELINNGRLVGMDGAAQHELIATFDFDVFEEYKVSVNTLDGTTPGVRNIEIINQVTGLPLTEDLINGYELLDVEQYYDEVADITYSNYYISIHGSDNVGPHSVNYEFLDETEIDPFTAQIHSGPKSNEIINIVLPGASVKSLGVRELSLLTQQSSSEAMTAIDNALTQVTSNRAVIGSSVSRIMKTYNNLMYRMENTDYTLAQIKAADVAENAMEYFKAKLATAKTLNFYNYSNFRQLTPSTIITQFYKN